MSTVSGARPSVDTFSPTSTHGHRGDLSTSSAVSASADGPWARRGSTASSIHSIGGSLDTASTVGNTLAESGRNAISTLLQPPIIRTGLLQHSAALASSSHKSPTTRDIPPVTLTNVPHVDPSDFQPYLSQVGPLYEQLQRARKTEEEENHGRGGRTEDLADMLTDDRLMTGKRSSAGAMSSVWSINAIASLDHPGLPRRPSSGYRKASAQGPPPLATIPAVYFEDGFHLENPRTFDVVSERSEVIRTTADGDKVSANGHASTPRKALATNAILQEKLSWYMDTVEIHLIESISTASTTFFSALSSLRELHSEAAESVERIKSLRRDLEALDGEIAATGLDIVQQRRRRENVRQLGDAVLQLREIVDGVARSESLIESGQVESALNSIDRLEKLMAGEDADGKRPGRSLQRWDLREATALQGTKANLDILRLRIGKSYETNFLTILLGDLRRHAKQVSSHEVLSRWASASMRGRGAHPREPPRLPSYMATECLREEVLSSLNGLQRAKHLTAATTTYREAVVREIGAIIRRPLPSSDEDDNESMVSSSTLTGGRQLSQKEKSSILARNLRALEAKEAEDLLVNVYVAVTETLRRLGTQVKVMLDVASSMGDSGSGLRWPPMKSPPFSPGGRKPSITALEAQEEIHKALDLANLLGQCVDVAQNKIVKMLRVRSEQSTHLELVRFLRYFTLNLHFATECENISGRSGTPLKNVVNGHIKEFVQYHADVEKQKLAQGMESDQWNAHDFDETESRLLSQMAECGSQDCSAWTEGSRIWERYPTGDEASHDGLEPQPQPNGNGNGRAKTRSAVLDGDAFLVPNSAVLCLKGIAHFLHLIAGIPSMTADISMSLIGFLQLFNSRCTQLILGAGATRSAGLKNITTKHLALASQALALIAAVLPHVREFVRRHCAGNVPVSLTAEFDKVRRLFQDHRSSIQYKLVEIMSGRALVATKKMKALDWDAGNDSVHEYMDTLVKETTTLHRNLIRHLPQGIVRSIMTPVFRSYRDTFGSVLRAAEPKTEAGRARYVTARLRGRPLLTETGSMLRDLAFFQSRLGKIEGFEDSDMVMREIIMGKAVRGPTPASPAHAGAPVSVDGSTEPDTPPAPDETEKKDGGAAKAEAAGQPDPAASKPERAEESMT